MPIYICVGSLQNFSCKSAIFPGGKSCSATDTKSLSPEVDCPFLLESTEYEKNPGGKTGSDEAGNVVPDGKTGFPWVEGTPKSTPGGGGFDPELIKLLFQACAMISYNL